MSVKVEQLDNGSFKLSQPLLIKNISRDGRYRQGNCQVKYRILITFAGCPLTWSSKLQTETALRTTEAEL